MPADRFGTAGGHAFTSLHGRTREGLVVCSRRGMLKASLAGMAGLSLPGLLQFRANAAAAGRPAPTGRSVILLWMAGGPSHIDTWDVKPEAPPEIRGPFGSIATRLPGIRISEHLPKQAAMLDKLTIIRSVDPTDSNHEPNRVFQTGNREAEPRLNPNGDRYPAIASIVAKMHGANRAGMPPYVACMKSTSHIGFGGWLGKEFDPFIAENAARLPVYTDIGKETGKFTGARLFHMPMGLDDERIESRSELLRSFDRLRADLDRSGSMQALDTYQQQAVQMVAGDLAREAFDIDREQAEVRERYGKHLWCQEAMLARRLVERGVAFVTLDLSHHGSSGTWDTHGDNIPPYGGITKGLGPLLPVFDHLLTTLVADLEERGLLDQVLVIAMGEFGRTPMIGTQGSTDGRDHWPVVMSMVLAGGGFRHGQVIGASDRTGGQIRERPVTPGDLAATIYQHMGVPLDATYLDARGRPRNTVIDGAPIAELV